MKKDIGQLHPAVSLILYLALIVLSSACISPILSPVSLISAILASVAVGQGKRFMPMLRLMLPTALVILFVTVLFNGNGVTLLFTVFNKPVTLEAVIYGVLSVISFAAVLLWACLLGNTLGTDEIIYLFGRVSPYSALLTGMVFGLVPTMLSRYDEIRDLRKAGTVSKKTAVGEMTALVFWSLEASLETAASMRSRGHGTGKPVHLTDYRFSQPDIAVAVLFLPLIVLLILAKALGYSYSVYPIFSLPQAKLQNVMFSAAFCMIMLIPFIHEIWEKIRWNFSMSKT